MLARRAQFKLLYNNIDISADLAPYLKSVSFTDYASAKADDLQITLEDKAGLWRGDWLPSKGAVVTAAIQTQAWWRKSDEFEQLALGTFEIDEIESGGPPETVTIKALSVPESTALRGQDKNRSWEKTRLSVIARDIASGAGLDLFFDTTDDPVHDRIEQTEQSDLSLLLKLCEDAGLALKITDKQIIIFDEQKYEQSDPIMTIVRGTDLVISYRITSSIRDIYSACRVKYQQASKKGMIDYTFSPPNRPSTGKMLIINEKVTSIAEAEKLAKKRLREKNKEEVKVSISIVGSLALLATRTVMLSGWGAFDGKYYIVSADHSLGGGYTVNLDLRRVLNGY